VKEIAHDKVLAPIIAHLQDNDANTWKETLTKIQKMTLVFVLKMAL